MNKKAKFTYRGMNKDVTRSKHPFEFYYEGRNIRIITTGSQSTGSLSNEKGNSLVIDLPNPCIEILNNSEINPSGIITYNEEELQFNSYELIKQREFVLGDCEEDIGINECSGDQQIIGYTVTRNSIILFTTDSEGFDCIWEVNEVLNDSYDLKLLYVRNLGFSIDNPIQALYNYENNIIQKIYWVDGKNQLRFLNIKHSIENGDIEELIDLKSSNLDIAGEYDLSQPIITEVSQSGQHTAGMIQYSYNLYKLNGNQTVISPFSELVSLDKGQSLGGGDVNEIVGASPVIQINNLDNTYTHIKLYAIKYTSFNQIPEISIIVDQEIDNYDEFNYVDDGSQIEIISLDNFIFLGSNPFIPQHIETKDNRMFASNLKDKAYLLDIDMRAYSHNDAGNCKIINIEQIGSNGLPIPDVGLSVNTTTYNVPEHDSINPNYDVYRYQSDGSTFGGEGKFIKYELTTDNTIDNSENKFFKDGELYRLGIQFYNKLGQKSFPLWIADFKAKTGNLVGNYNILDVELKSEFYTYIENLCLPEDEQPIGYKIIRADRTDKDRSITCQGALNGMMCQGVGDLGELNQLRTLESERNTKSNELVKLPQPITRGFESNVIPINKADHLRLLSEEGDYSGVQGYDGEFSAEEIYSDSNGEVQVSWQYNKLFNLYSPEVLFNFPLSFQPSSKIAVRGIAQNTQDYIWEKRIDKNTLETYNSDKTNVTDTGSFQDQIDIRFLGLFGPTTEDKVMNQNLISREYNNFRISENTEWDIYGIPEISERGQGTTTYNGDPKLEYTNTLTSFITDGSDQSVPITSMNSHHTKCLVLAEGSDDIDIEDRKSLEYLHSNSSPTTDDGLLIVEIKKPKSFLYGNVIYGGNSIEAKSRSSYIEIGDYQDINTTQVNIKSPGDTYVQNFKFARLSKTDTQVIDNRTLQVTEYTSFPVETSINLTNRNDISRFNWDINFDPRYNEIHKYNRVYSQSPNLIQNTDVSFKFKKVNSFDTRVIASKQKVPGELIDSYTDFLENEILDLDGKYGAINGMVTFNDDIFTIQDEAVAKLLINPRAQVQSTDGISLELGTGGILYDHQYLTTTSGSINKWAIVKSPTGFYYLDTFNKAWRKFSSGQGILNITDINGFYSYFQNTLEYNNLLNDNPITKLGAVGGFNFADGNSYLTIHNGKKSFTLNFNERSNSLESFWDFKPSWYINKGDKMFTTHPDNNKLYEHGIGNYQEYYDAYYSAYVTLMINPEADLECVFNNIEYKSELYLNDIDQPTKTLSYIQAWNEYQTSNRIPLELGRNKNLRRKFRNWRALIPRQAGSRDRIRNPWIFLKLELDTENNYKFILHDIIVHYTV